MSRNTRNSELSLKYLKGSKGSVLIVSLVVFSIISTVCISCIAYIFTNSNISNLEYKENKLKEDALSGIELSKSNLITQAILAEKSSKDRIDFKEYFLGNNKESFLNRIRNIEKSSLNSVAITVLNNKVYEEDGLILMQLSSVSRLDNYRKTIYMSVAICYQEQNDSTGIDEGKLIKFYNYRGL